MLLGSVLLPVLIYVAIGWYIVPHYIKGSPEGTLGLAVIAMAACGFLMFVLLVSSVFVISRMASHQSDGASNRHSKR